MTSEATIQRRVWLALGARCRLFRVNTGRAWVGSGPGKRMPDSSVVVPFGRPVTLGFGMPNGDPVNGTPDLCGWTPVVITADMVGRTVPVFTGIEVKESGGGKKRDAQINFVQQVHAAGGIAGFASSEAQAHEIIDAWFRGGSPSVM